MDGKKFDDLAKRLGTGVNRRQMLRGLFAGAGAVAGASLLHESANAAVGDTCSVDGDCGGGELVCNYGFCEDPNEGKSTICHITDESNVIPTTVGWSVVQLHITNHGDYLYTNCCEDGDCGAGESCVSGTCGGSTTTTPTPGDDDDYDCYVDADCGSREICCSGRCYESTCCADTDCDNGCLSCVDGSCNPQCDRATCCSVDYDRAKWFCYDPASETCTPGDDDDDNDTGYLELTKYFCESDKAWTEITQDAVEPSSGGNCFPGVASFEIWPFGDSGSAIPVQTDANGKLFVELPAGTHTLKEVVTGVTTEFTIDDYKTTYLVVKNYYTKDSPDKPHDKPVTTTPAPVGSPVGGKTDEVSTLPSTGTGENASQQFGIGAALAGGAAALFAAKYLKQDNAEEAPAEDQ